MGFVNSVLAMLAGSGVWIAAGIGAAVVISLLISAMYRTVVSTNDVHIVVHKKTTKSYGREQPAGNVYMKWPTWWPFIGRKVITLPISNFQIDLPDYEAYDKGRVQFLVDIMAFFRIEDSAVAAARVHSFDSKPGTQDDGSLKHQLTGIIQDAVRSILAKAHIEDILEERAKFAKEFTDAVIPQLDEWGVKSVKSIALMDIRDHPSSKVIHNIMMKKQSQVEKESRVEVANNKRTYEIAEVEANRDVELRRQEAAQQVGQRTAEKVKEVGIADEKAQQQIKEEKKETATKEMAVQEVTFVRSAEIKRRGELVVADQEKQKKVISSEANKEQQRIEAEGFKAQTVLHAEAEKESTVLHAIGNLEEAKRVAEGTQVKGEADGKAKYAIEVAPINAQIVLAKEIGDNKEYQTYLFTMRTIEKDEAVGTANAKALEHAEIKVVASTGPNASAGLASVGELFSAAGGQKLGAMLETLANTSPAAASVIETAKKKFNGGGKNAGE